MSGLLTIDEALERVVARVRARAAEEVATRDGLGRVLAEDGAAVTDLPPFDSSAMDGYALRSADTPGTLAIRGESAAGAPAGRGLEAGEAFGISTGAMVPAGADAIVPVEHVRVDGSQVTVESVARGANVRPRGGDTHAGDVVVARGTRLGPPQLGALAAAGVGTVRCARRPRVAILATGSELRAPGEPLGPGQIYESNSVLLAAQVATAGGVAETHDPVADDEAATRDALERALDADVVLSSGGVSVGPHDLVRTLLAELGVEEVFWGVAVRPGKPLFFGVRGDTLVFGLPGNPVSTLVGFELFVRPALAGLQGAEPVRAFRSGTLAAPLRRNPARDDLVRAVSHADGGDVLLEPLSGQESHMIVRAAAADALVHVPRGDGELPRGAHVSWLRV